MKVIFLDFDGVLCNHESITTGYKARIAPEQDPYGAHPDCVAALNRIIAETGAVILDDDSDMGQLRPKLVRSSNVDGLTMADAERAIEILASTASIAVRESCGAP
jgi:hypothetical protein